MMRVETARPYDPFTFERVQPRCPLVGSCGGCSLQDLAYADQLRLKTHRLRQALAPVASAGAVDVIGCDEPWRYRNRAEFSFGDANGQLVLGYHAARSFWRVVDVDDCLLLPDSLMAVARTVEELARESRYPAYQPRTHQGVFRYVTVRGSQATGQTMVCLTTTACARDVVVSLAAKIRRRHPHVVSVYWGVTEKPADSSAPDALECLDGEPYLEERVGSLSVLLHPLSFTQPNVRQAERLYATVTDWVTSCCQGVAWDLYCGVGMIGLHLAPRLARVYGIEVEACAVEMARLNAARNGSTNLDVVGGAAETVLADKRFWLGPARPEAIVVDPPRAGLHERALSALLAARPRQLVYVSCNPSTLVRDLQVLLHSYPRYRLGGVGRVDMFPQTPHVEVLARLERRSLG